MTPVLWLALALLADWWLTTFLAQGRGPFKIGTGIRSVFGVHHDEDGAPAHDEQGAVLFNSVSSWAWLDNLAHEIGFGLTCVHCCSTWISLLMALALTRLAPAIVFDWLSYLIVAAALAAGVVLIDAKV